MEVLYDERFSPVKSLEMATAAGSGRRRAVLWSMVFGYGALAFALVRNIVLVPIYLHYFDLGEYGAWLATGGALAQILVTDFGLTGVVTQRVAHSLGAADLTRLRSLIAAGLVNAAGLAVVLTLLCVALAPLLPNMQGLSESQTHRVLKAFLLAVTANGFAVVGNTLIGIIRSMQRAAAAGTLVLSADAIGVVVTILMLVAGLGILALPLGLLGRSVASVVGGMGVLAATWIREKWPRMRFERAQSAALWRDSLQFFLTSIAMRLQSNANVLFIGLISGPQSAALYGLTVRAHETVAILIAQTNNALAPSLAHLLGENRQQRFRDLSLKLLLMIAAVSAVGMATTVALNESFVRLWVGPDAFGGQSTSIWMGIALWVGSIAYVAYDSLLAAGQFKLIARTFISASAVHVVLLLILVRFGLWGAPVALLITTTVWGAVLWRRLAREIHFSAGEALAASADIARVVVICAAAAAVVSVCFPKGTSWYNLIIEGMARAGIGVLALAFLHPNLRRGMREEIPWFARLGSHGSR